MMANTWEDQYGSLLDRPRFKVAKRLIEARDLIHSVIWGNGDEDELVLAKIILEDLVDKIVLSAVNVQSVSVRVANDDETRMPDDEESGDSHVSYGG